MGREGIEEEEKSVFVQAAPAPPDSLPATEAKRRADLLRCAGTRLGRRAGTGAAGDGKEHKSTFRWQSQTPHLQPLFGQSYDSQRYLARGRSAPSRRLLVTKKTQTRVFPSIFASVEPAFRPPPSHPMLGCPLPPFPTCSFALSQCRMKEKREF